MDRRVLPAVIAAALLAPAAAAPTDRFPKVATAYVVAVDGAVLWERNADLPRPPASLAKIMAALVLLDGEWHPDAVVTISERAARERGSRLGLRSGEQIKASDLLTALLVRSANDAAVALAEHAAGSVERFVAIMNEKAGALGLAGTRFANPTGFDAPGQTSTARDLLRLTEAALAHGEFARVVALDRASVTTLGGRRFDLETSNALLGRLAGVAGVKTGYTSGAGKCVVALAEREEHRVLLVLLDAPDRWWVADAMIREAFDAAAAAD